MEILWEASSPRRRTRGAKTHSFFPLLLLPPPLHSRQVMPALSTPPQIPSDLGARVLATLEMKGAAAEEGDAAVTAPPPPLPTCPVCFDPWTCSGDHRICCIPCGHVYGRSCLERWLHHSAGDYAKCPQCGEQFEDKLIINLYAPGNLWDGCCHLQELKAHYKSVTKEMEGHMLSMVTEYTSQVDSKLDRLRAEMKEEIAKSHEELKESFRAEWEQALDQINRSCNEKRATANANMTLMKDQMKKMTEELDQIKKMAEEENVTATDLLDQMKKMAEEENATAADLLEFMERSLHPTGHQTNQNGCISMGISKRRSFCPIYSGGIVWFLFSFSLVAFFSVLFLLSV